MRYYVTVEGETREVDLDAAGIRVDGKPVDVELARVPGTDVHSLILDHRSHRLLVRRNGDGAWDLHLRGRRIRARVVDERTRQIQEMTGMAAGPGGPELIRAPMPGLVVQVDVEEGQEVAPGDGLVVVEAMKMENELRAEVPAVVEAVRVAPGDAVEKGQVLIEFESSTEEG